MTDNIYYLDNDGVVRDASTYEKQEDWTVLTEKELQDYLASTTPLSEVIEIETNWQKIELEQVEGAISNYQQDLLIPEIYSELRVTTYTESDYYALLGDRKLLIDYLQQVDFPQCGRPSLSGLV